MRNCLAGRKHFSTLTALAVDPSLMVLATILFKLWGNAIYGEMGNSVTIFLSQAFFGNF